MNPRELVDHIRSGPAKLVLDKPLRFRRRTRSNRCDFSEFLQALQSSETIRTVRCRSHQEMGISEDEWVLLVKTLGRITDIQQLDFNCSGSRHFYPFQAVANAVNNAPSLCKLEVVLDLSFPRDPSGLTALANALREHTSLREFTWIDHCSWAEAAHSIVLDPVLWAFPTCPHLQKVTIMTEYASADAIKNLMRLQSATDLHLMLKKENWLAVADEIRRGRCNVRLLNLGMFTGALSDVMEVAKSVASAIQLDQKMEHITLRNNNGFTDEAGVALAEALTVNKNLRQVDLLAKLFRTSRSVHNKATLGVQSYKAFSAVLRANTSLVLNLPAFETAGADERLCESYDQLRIEKLLNRVGRGNLVSSSQTTRKQWVDALNVLNRLDESPAFEVSCLYSLLRLSPDCWC
jgi:hypothetical protein